MIKINFLKDESKAVAFDGEAIVGLCEYIEMENVWNIVHTEVDNNYQGQGVARNLVECILENAPKYNKKVVADCSYAQKVIEKNNSKM